MPLDRKASLIVATLLVGCAPPNTGDLFNTVEMTVEADVGPVHERLIELVDGAEEQVLAVLPALEDPAVADAIIEAWDRGLLVEVVTDIDHEADEGVQMLLDAGVPVQLGDGEMTYTEFGIGTVTEITVPSEFVQMSTAYVVVDENRVISATELGSLESGARIAFDIKSEDLVDDFVMEHNQLFGGTDASSLTAFSSLAKSITDSRWLYPNQTGLDFEVWVGPQERVVKRMIDAVYTARSSIYLLTEDFLDQGLAKALQDKAADGFEVLVVVGPTFGSTSTYSDTFLNETPDVGKHQVVDAVGRIPTVMLVDSRPEANPMGLDISPRAKAFVLTHDVVSAIRYELEPAPDGSFDVSSVRSDQLTDGVLYVIGDPNHDPESPSPELDAVLTTISEHLDIAVSL